LQQDAYEVLNLAPPVPPRLARALGGREQDEQDGQDEQDEQDEADDGHHQSLRASLQGASAPPPPTSRLPWLSLPMFEHASCLFVLRLVVGASCVLICVLRVVLACGLLVHRDFCVHAQLAACGG
jgi:hypothetical protein